MPRNPRLLIAFVLIVSRCESLRAADTLPPGAAIYEEFPQALRSSLLTAYQAEITRQEKVVSVANAARVKAKSRTEREIATEEYEAAEKNLEYLKNSNRQPFVGSSIKRKGWMTGDIGEPDRPIRIVKVVDEMSALVIYNSTGLEDDLVLLNGISTLGWSNGSDRQLRGPLMVSGTAALGDKATVLVAERFSWPKYRKWLDKQVQ